jgi:hypothetical protein
MQTNETVVALTGVLVVFGLPLLLVAIVLLYKHRRMRMTHETIMRLAEKGIPVPPELLEPPAAANLGLARGAGADRAGGRVVDLFPREGRRLVDRADPGLHGRSAAHRVGHRIEGTREERAASLTMPAAPGGLGCRAHLRGPRARRPATRSRRSCAGHQSQVRTVLRRLTKGDLALADDLAQETFVLAWRNLARFRFEARFSTWLYRIAFNAWQSDARKRREVLLDTDDEMPAFEVAAAEPGVDHASRIDLERALATLSDGERAADLGLLLRGPLARGSGRGARAFRWEP